MARSKKLYNVLAIGDLHAYVNHPGYLDFNMDLYEEWNCDTVVFIGDVADQHHLSQWPKDPRVPGPKDEYKLTKAEIAKWYKAFPNAYVCIGNHDERPERMAKNCGFLPELMPTHNKLWDTPNWKWVEDVIIDKVYYVHGTGQGGVHPAWCLMRKMMMSVVMGHIHSRAGVKYAASPAKATFALDTGCDIDVKAFQFVYGKHCKDRPVLASGIILGGKHAYSELMPIGPGEKYDNALYPQTACRQRMYWD